MKTVRVRLGERSYTIVMGSGLIKKSGSFISGLKIGRDAVIVTNKRLLALYKKPLSDSLKKSGFTMRFETIPDSERAKSSSVVTRITKKISAYDKHKDIFIIAFGGGVVGDLAGFVAAVYKRGIPYVQIPTTLLAQVDSAIGGKVAIDLAVAKNLVGAFYQPRIVLADISLIRSLSLRQLRNGLAEVIKYGVIKDRRLFEYLEDNYESLLRCEEKPLEFVVSRSSEIKARLVEKDEFDKKGERVILNFGHTIGHAIEAASSYSRKYSHGEAIAIGMVAASKISLRLGLMKTTGDAKRIEALIERSGLPTRFKGLDISKIYEAHLHDKKFIHGKNRFVLPVRIGKVKVVEDVEDNIVKDALRQSQGE